MDINPIYYSCKYINMQILYNRWCQYQAVECSRRPTKQLVFEFHSFSIHVSHPCLRAHVWIAGLSNFCTLNPVWEKWSLYTWLEQSDAFQLSWVSFSIKGLLVTGLLLALKVSWRAFTLDVQSLKIYIFYSPFCFYFFFNFFFHAYKWFVK